MAESEQEMLIMQIGFRLALQRSRKSQTEIRVGE